MPIRPLLLIACCLASAAFAEVKLPRIFSNNMVLQRGVRVPVWGTAAPDETVTVRLAGQEARTTAGAAGAWSVRLEPLPAGGPYTMTVSGANTLNVSNVMVGEVWLASGQSNMVFNLSTAADAAREIAAANNPRLRVFTVPTTASAAPRTDVNSGAWNVASPTTARAFSAIGYHFARKLIEELDVPVGIIVSAVNGTPAESWVSREALASVPQLKEFSELQLSNYASLGSAQQSYWRAMAVWEAQTTVRDPGDMGLGASWANPSLDTRDWKRFWMPSYTYVTDLCSGGVIWFRKEVDIPAAMAGKNMTLALGAIAERDWVFYNGTMIGAGGAAGPLYSSTSRSYTVPAALATAGRGVIAIRVFAHTRTAGQLCSPGSTTLAGSGVTLNLHSWWQSKVEFQFARQTPAVEASLPVVPVSSANSVSTMLYNGMIAPLIPYAMQGAIWYQGEQNSTRGAQYRALFPTLIKDWRARWGRDFPFYFVQLANFMGTEAEPAEADWAEVREAQLLAAKEVPGSGMAVIIDIGTADNIHPPNKQDVGARLARLAFNRTYGRTMEDSGPELESWAVEGGAIRLRFAHTTGGLVTADGKAPQQFAVAGADRVFRWAQAVIEGSTVVVRSAAVPNPVAVRYAWANNPEGANLRNGAGLPASPFRTDTWPRALPAACAR